MARGPHTQNRCRLCDQAGRHTVLCSTSHHTTPQPPPPPQPPRPQLQLGRLASVRATTLAVDMLVYVDGACWVQSRRERLTRKSAGRCSCGVGSPLWRAAPETCGGARTRRRFHETHGAPQRLARPPPGRGGEREGGAPNLFRSQCPWKIRTARCACALMRVSGHVLDDLTATLPPP